MWVPKKTHYTNFYFHKHWIQISFYFQSSEENKLIYTDIFNEYTVEIEKYIETALLQVVFGYSWNIYLI